MNIHYILGYRNKSTRYMVEKANSVAINAAFHNVKWEEQMETKEVNERWADHKLKIEEEVKQICR